MSEEQIPAEPSERMAQAEAPLEPVIEQVDDTSAYEMPIADLKRQAFSPAPETPPAPSVWGEMTENPDGSFQVQLSTGEVFRGPAREVIAKQAEAHYHTKRWALDWKQKYESVKPGETQAELQPQPEVSPEQLQQFQRQLGLESLGAALGVPAEQVPAVVQQYTAAQGDAQALIVYNKFVNECPDYTDSQQNREALLSYLPQDYFPSSEDLKVSWARAIYEHKGTPYKGNEAPPRPIPPAMPSSAGSSMQSQEADAWRMPIAQLRKLALENRENNK